MKAPSIARLMAKLRMTRDEAKQARDAMHYCRLGAVKAAGFFGMEHVYDAHGHIVLVYLNSGDTYSPTLVRRDRSDTYRISTLGDEVEALEKRGIRCA